MSHQGIIFLRWAHMLFSLKKGKGSLWEALKYPGIRFQLFQPSRDSITMFENHPKCLIQHCERSELRLHFEWTKVHSKCQKWSIWRVLAILILAFFTNFCPIKSNSSGNTVRQVASDFQKLAKIDHYTQNVNLARFARNVELDFFFDFQTL